MLAYQSHAFAMSYGAPAFHVFGGRSRGAVQGSLPDTQTLGNRRPGVPFCTQASHSTRVYSYFRASELHAARPGCC